jgi:hypothetical protein
VKGSNLDKDRSKLLTKAPVVGNVEETQEVVHTSAQNSISYALEGDEIATANNAKKVATISGTTGWGSTGLTLAEKLKKAEAEKAQLAAEVLLLFYVIIYLKLCLFSLADCVHMLLYFNFFRKNFLINPIHHHNHHIYHNNRYKRYKFFLF